MKKILAFSLVAAFFISCSTPLPVTGNPNDHTSTSGTAGSSKMTTQVYKPDQSKVIRDSLKLKIDSAKRDTSRMR